MEPGTRHMSLHTSLVTDNSERNGNELMGQIPPHRLAVHNRTGPVLSVANLRHRQLLHRGFSILPWLLENGEVQHVGRL